MIKNFYITIPLDILLALTIKYEVYFFSGVVLGLTYLAGMYYGEKA